MSTAITADDVDAQFYEASAAISKASSSVKKNVPVYRVAPGLWKLNRAFKQLNELYVKLLEFEGVPGVTCQHFEKAIADLIRRAEDLLNVCKTRGLNNCMLTSASLRSISAQLEQLKDIWVAISSSTDADLDESLKASDAKEYVEWESLWR